jgi:EAL domain-containing protein (putative c-di-GMP-specific phosphodiesterase class I)
MFSYSFQPIVNVETKTVVAYEALIRGKNNELPSYVYSQIAKSDLVEFDQISRCEAIRLAAQLNIPCQLHLNFMAACIQGSDVYLHATKEAFLTNHLSISQLVVEILEGEIIHDYFSFTKLINRYKGMGASVAIDDFGSGYSGLNLVANFQPDIIKLDREIIQNIEFYGPRQAIIKATILMCESLGIDIIAEGVETISEYKWLKKNGIYLFQGYLFAKPGFECLPQVIYPDE